MLDVQRDHDLEDLAYLLDIGLRKARTHLRIVGILSRLPLSVCIWLVISILICLVSSGIPALARVNPGPAIWWTLFFVLCGNILLAALLPLSVSGTAREVDRICATKERLASASELTAKKSSSLSSVERLQIADAIETLNGIEFWCAIRPPFRRLWFWVAIVLLILLLALLYVHKLPQNLISPHPVSAVSVHRKLVSMSHKSGSSGSFKAKALRDAGNAPGSPHPARAVTRPGNTKQSQGTSTPHGHTTGQINSTSGPTAAHSQGHTVTANSGKSANTSTRPSSGAVRQSGKGGAEHTTSKVGQNSGKASDASNGKPTGRTSDGAANPTSPRSVSSRNNPNNPNNPNNVVKSGGALGGTRGSNTGGKPVVVQSKHSGGMIGHGSGVPGRKGGIGGGASRIASVKRGPQHHGAQDLNLKGNASGGQVGKSTMGPSSGAQRPIHSNVASKSGLARASHQREISRDTEEVPFEDRSLVRAYFDRLRGASRP